MPQRRNKFDHSTTKGQRLRRTRVQNLTSNNAHDNVSDVMAVDTGSRDSTPHRRMEIDNVSLDVDPVISSIPQFIDEGNILLQEVAIDCEEENMDWNINYTQDFYISENPSSLHRPLNQPMTQRVTQTDMFQGRKYVSEVNIQSLTLDHTYTSVSQYEYGLTAYSIGCMNIVCPHCDALLFAGETQKLRCCHNGKVHLPASAPYPDEFKLLLTCTTPQSRNFKSNIRQYNSAMAFASFEGNTPRLGGNAPPTFRLHGQLYHRMGSLHPQDEQKPTYSQLYILETNKAIECRLSRKENDNCLPEIFNLLSAVLENVNPFALAFKHMHEVEQEQLAIAESNNVPLSSVCMYIRKGHDERRYNKPTYNEIAAVFVTNDGTPPTERDVIIYPRNAPLQKLSHIAGSIDPLVYPLLFPHGEYGWYPGIQHHPDHCTETRKKITCLQFYSHKLSVRNTFSPIFHAGLLSQQYFVDIYTRVEANTLSWIQHNQTKLRADTYAGLMDHINSAAERHLHGESQAHSDSTNNKPGLPVILPSTFQGSPRCMQQNFQDAMSVVCKYGKPDLFITFTCNPNWKDIKAALHPGQTAADRPDIVARVFKLYLDEFLNDIKNEHVLGKVVAHIYVIEFQKRGLPHCHLLVFFDSESKLRDTEDINALISAEIPDEDINPQLHNIVKSHMVHGPCGILGKDAPCMKNDICTKDYPKEFCEKTSMNAAGYPVYRRSDNGVTIFVRGKEVDNRWIVPYNAYLLLKYNSHINVEACTTTKSVKYLFKYIYKGHDCANIEMICKDKYNEISTFLDARYVSAPEACWRIFSYKMHDKSHSIIRLALHLENLQQVMFKKGHHEEAVELASRNDTALTAFFKTNQLHQTSYTYHEFPKYFVFKKSSSKWVPRKRGGDSVISRIYAANPKDPERFCLRLLLLHVPGPKSYEDLKTVDGEIYPTFKEACIQRHLLEDDAEWDRTLLEAASFQMPRQLRTLFATLCIFSQPSDAHALWEKHKVSMTEDYTYNHITDEAAEQLSLCQIEDVLQQGGFSCEELGLPLIPNQIINNASSINITDEAEKYEQHRQQLNEDQMKVIQIVQRNIDDMRAGYEPQCRTYFLSGAGGTGKTKCYNTLIAYCKSIGIKVAPSAWTGIAATLLSGGRTCHNLFKLPVPITETSICHIKPSSPYAAELSSNSLFIIDEASMLPKYALQAIDKMLRDITGIEHIPFGGKVFLLGGDFRQVLPVIPRQPSTVVVENTIKRSDLWPHFEVIHLTRNMRTKSEEQEFAEWLVKLGNGTLTNPISTLPHTTIEIHPDMNITHNIIDTVFPDVSNPAAISTHGILCPLNETTLEVNDTVVKKLHENSKIYYSADKAICDDDNEANNYPVEFLNSLTPTGMPPHILTLKKNAIVMLLRNMNIKDGLCNGTRLLIKHLHDRVIDAEILVGENKGHRVLIPRIRLNPSDASLPFQLQRTQFPIRIAYCLTINKSQGQTFDKLGILLPKPVFSHGQLYVALSRARAFKDVTLQLGQTTVQGMIKSKTVTQNIVYRDVIDEF